LIGASGEQVGIVSLAAANKLAEEAELDLVEIAPTATPPVCRIMDYGKYKYREAKKRHEAKLSKAESSSRSQVPAGHRWGITGSSCGT
jgi:translation initiation factor IF-3